MKVSDTEDVGVIARQRRQELRISQADLAARAGVTRQWLTRFERGNSEVTLSKVFAVLRELNLKVRLDAAEDAAVPKVALYDIPRITMPRIEIPQILPNIKMTIPNIDMTNVMPNLKITSMIPKINVSDILTNNAKENIIRSLSSSDVPPLKDPARLAHVKEQIKTIEAAEADEDE